MNQTSAYCRTCGWSQVWRTDLRTPDTDQHIDYAEHALAKHRTNQHPGRETRTT